ncbi:permease YjgP/YjgQ [Campylobacter sputorum subsp. bubulus]|uniref:Permease YjgP/YjgQ n=1 Tax=Campylobacter sputorum subsp. sputorum TaxID=32024 RepID=A0A381DIR5_9BACT|nr:LptF/LptG family permease [Campylobacter sputorum]ASM35600.1 putative lipooligosaccharide transport system, permease component (LptG family) [Campylobacter sputorum aubsp. sputorum RM3237]KAB0582668.1 LptF/LptG family permease [Campylobacter sputorum subsp. sputorum]QEL05791.1 lipooligosaccharide transport system, ABC transporter permease component LptG [Campylobacter sputorum subsp. sputorum]SUX08071.1 permease YjgP/YjgQ [Campylobacter sputorum subsp. bubulus]SUX10568.1 permease YjgP/YjgQ 
MKIYAKHIAYVYFKYFLIIFIALELFYAGIDILTNLKRFPESANLQLIYFFLTTLIALNYILPLSLVFAFIATYFNMIRNNELVSFYALGIDKNRVIMPTFLVALIVTCSYIALNFTNFTYIKEYRKNIASSSFMPQNLDEKFVKYDGKYIYISRLNPITNDAKIINIFDVNDTKLLSIVSASSGKFDGKIWNLEDVNITNLPSNLEFMAKGFEVQHLENLETLKKFRPKTIENIYESDTPYSINDALDAIKTFKNEGININSLKVSLYNSIFFPLFAPIMVLIFYYFLPSTYRFFNLALLGFIFVVATLCCWGVLYVLIRFSQNGVILAELGVVLPIFLLFLFAIKLYFSNR